MAISFGNIGGNMEVGDIAGQDMSKTNVVHAVSVDVERLRELADKKDKTDAEADELAEGACMIPEFVKDVVRGVLVRTPEMILKYLILDKYHHNLKDNQLQSQNKDDLNIL